MEIKVASSRDILDILKKEKKAALDVTMAFEYFQNFRYKERYFSLPKHLKPKKGNVFKRFLDGLVVNCIQSDCKFYDTLYSEKKHVASDFRRGGPTEHPRPNIKHLGRGDS